MNASDFVPSHGISRAPTANVGEAWSTWAPADLFTPTVNAIAVALQRAMTLISTNLVFVFIGVAVIISIAIAVVTLVRKPDR